MSLLSRFPRAIVWGLCGIATACPAADVPRIVRLASAPVRPAAEPIREPAPRAAAMEQPPLETRRPVEIERRGELPRRSEFVPIALPDPAPPFASSPVPELAARPQFTAPPLTEPTPSPPTIAEPVVNAGPLLASPASPPAFALPPAPPPSPSLAAEQPAATLQQPPPPVVTPPVTAPPITETPVQSDRRSIWEPSPAVPAANTAAMNAAINVVAQRAMQKADQASSLAQRGMLYSARAELVQALQLIAHALDAQSASPTHATALSAGLTAIEEARDFATQAAGPADAAQVQAIAASHRTQAFGTTDSPPTSPVAAQQAYLSLAQTQFIEAAGRVPAASQVLYRLGRLETAMSAHDTDPLALHAPQAMVFHQAALATDGGNWLAMNELGVLYARYGQLDSAKQLLLASVRANPHAAGWQNLAAIHRRLGETDLAKRAESERQLLASKQGATTASQSAPIQWVDTKTFAASSSQDAKWPAEVAKKSARP